MNIPALAQAVSLTLWFPILMWALLIDSRSPKWVKAVCIFVFCVWMISNITWFYFLADRGVM
jgi:hypothetical protein